MNKTVFLFHERETVFYLFGRALPGASGEYSEVESAAADFVDKNVIEALVKARIPVFLIADFLEIILIFVFDVLVVFFIS